jgi:5,10-methenyltetrahydrofolate synthetase
MSVPPDIARWRREQRAALIARRVAVPAAERQAWSKRITRQLLEGFPALEGAVVGCCWPYQGEFDARHVARHLRDRGARIVLPVVVAKGAPMEFREWWPGAPMGRGVLDLPFPEGTAVLQPQALLIPPVGFDDAGYRLGYGGGYFDRTLAALDPAPTCVGVAFELARCESTHPQPHDKPMDWIVTESGVFLGSERRS